MGINKLVLPAKRLGIMKEQLDKREVTLSADFVTVVDVDNELPNLIPQPTQHTRLTYPRVSLNVALKRIAP